MHSVAFTKDNFIAVSGITKANDSLPQGMFVTLIDTLGNVMEWTNIHDPKNEAILANNREVSMLVTQENLVVFLYGFIGRNSIGTAFYSHPDLFTIEYDMTAIVNGGDSVINTIPKDLIELDEGFIVTGSLQFQNYNEDAFVMRLDRSGNFKWMRTYGHPVYWENARNVTYVNDNKYMLSGTRYQWDQEPIFYHGWACAIDSLGNKEWEWEASETESPHRGIMSMQFDSVKHEWIYASFLERPTTNPGEDYDVMVPILVRRDSLMNLLAYEEYGPFAINHYIGVLEKSVSGGWIGAGSYTTTTDDYVSPIPSQSGRVIKISADHSLEWSVIDTAFYDSEHGSRSYLSGVNESPTGSIYAVGWANNYDENDEYRSYGWLLKITADGCVDTLCTTTSILDQMQKMHRKVLVYPNPVTDYVIFETHVDDCKSKAQIFDLHGRLLQQQQLTSEKHAVILDKSFYTSGIYVWHVTSMEDGQLIDSGKFVVR